LSFRRDATTHQSRSQSSSYSHRTNTRKYRLPLPTTRLTSTSTEIQLFPTAGICYLENPKPTTSAISTPLVYNSHTAFLQPLPPLSKDPREGNQNCPYQPPRHLPLRAFFASNAAHVLADLAHISCESQHLQICLSQRTFTLMAPEGQAVMISSVLESSSRTTQLF
jgi:hypothetical protein